MKDYAVDKIRNVALCGHGSSGKTSLTAALLFDTGATNRLLKVDKGNTVTDYDPDEIERKISINATPCYCEWKDHKVNVIDTPGYSNFLWDTRAALRAVDGAAVVIDAVAGVEVGTEKVWEMIEARGLPRIFVINKMDRENANFGRALDSVREFFGRQAVPVLLPIGEEKSFAGVVDVVEKKAYTFEKDESGKMTEGPVPAALADEVEKRYKELLEMVAESDEKLMEKYFETGALSAEEFRAGLKKSILNNQIYPVFAASGLVNIGAQTLLDGILAYLPSPVEAGNVKVLIGGEEKTVPPSPDAPFAAMVFKTISDPYTGRISLMRVFSGRTNPDGTVTNVGRETDEKLGGLFFLQGKEQVAAGQAKAGDIVATAKLKVTATGDTLSAKGSNIVFAPLVFPLPSISFAIEPKTRADEDRISQATHRIIEEDPTVRIERDPNTSQLLISG
ncbi:MAG: GTP-binding protein, partial [Acidobacteria bacterium]|nr:GTP-binding protein [Acidobacteriota bacterium]